MLVTTLVSCVCNDKINQLTNYYHNLHDIKLTERISGTRLELTIVNRNNHMMLSAYSGVSSWSWIHGWTGRLWPWLCTRIVWSFCASCCSGSCSWGVRHIRSSLPRITIGISRTWCLRRWCRRTWSGIIRLWLWPITVVRLISVSAIIVVSVVVLVIIILIVVILSTLIISLGRRILPLIIISSIRLKTKTAITYLLISLLLSLVPA